jgi:hypothetical protein
VTRQRCPLLPQLSNIVLEAQPGKFFLARKNKIKSIWNRRKEVKLFLSSDDRTLDKENPKDHTHRHIWGREKDVQRRPKTDRERERERERTIRKSEIRSLAR